MKSFHFLSFLILINLFNLYICLTVDLSAIKKGEELEVNCDYYTLKNETFTKLEISKDKTPFFVLSNITKTANISQLKDFPKITQTDGGHFKISSANSSVNGLYTCKVTTNVTNLGTSRDIKIEITNYAKTNLTAKMDIQAKDKQFWVNCSTNFFKDLKLTSLSVLKDMKPFLALLSDGKLSPDKLGYNETHSVTTPSLSILLNNTDNFHGTYCCQINFRNTTDTVDTLIASNMVPSPNGANSYSSDKLIMFLSTFLLIFVSFK